MNRIVMKSRVGNDGELRLRLPVGWLETGDEIEVSVEAIEPKSKPTRLEWNEWVDSLAGAWQGDFERPAEGTLQERDAL